MQNIYLFILMVNLTILSYRNLIYIFMDNITLYKSRFWWGCIFIVWLPLKLYKESSFRFIRRDEGTRTAPPCITFGDWCTARTNVFQTLYLLGLRFARKQVIPKGSVMWCPRPLSCVFRTLLMSRMCLGKLSYFHFVQTRFIIPRN